MKTLDIDFFINKTIKILKEYEPEEGYYLAFSGGKDSIVLKHLCDQANIKYDAHYSVTTVDPPELVKYIRKEHKDVIFDFPKLSMFQLIPKKKMPPTRLVRYCCEKLKENGGKGRFKLTGIRADESRSRSQRKQIEIKGKRKIKKMMHPLFYWIELHIWDYIEKYNLPYCSLYDTGKHRIGCVMCPMQGRRGMERDAMNYPKHFFAYLNAFEKMLEECEKAGLKTFAWKTAEDVMDWWIYGQKKYEKRKIKTEKIRKAQNKKKAS